MHSSYKLLARNAPVGEVMSSMQAVELVMVVWRPMIGWYAYNVLHSHLIITVCINSLPIFWLKCILMVDLGSSARWPRLGRGRSVCPSPGSLKVSISPYMCHRCSCGMSIQIVQCILKLKRHSWPDMIRGGAGLFAQLRPREIMAMHLVVWMGACLPDVIMRTLGVSGCP